ncbi:hypothetical protein VNO77_44342 [Canavalia gladiata]|uniref:Uncharacterized protein n=1 Tax=Canavalia gladiata TaxID=3824 RepID=A0AAN9JY26_CANGL
MEFCPNVIHYPPKNILKTHNTPLILCRGDFTNCSASLSFFHCFLPPLLVTKPSLSLSNCNCNLGLV